MKKFFLKFSSLTFLLLASLLASTSPVKAVACTEPSASGNYTVASSCSFGRAGIDGVDNGDITINSGVSLTITNGQTIVWNTGKKITITTGGSIQNSGGSLFQGSLYAVDEDGDLYGKSTTASSEDYAQFYTSAGANRVRVSTLTSRADGSGDCQDTNAATPDCYSYAYSQSTYWSYGYGQSNYYRYAYGQSNYYRYSYGQSNYYRYSYGQGYYCFLEDTKILLADGSYKAIKDIKAGDQVVSYDTKTGERVTDSVDKLIVHNDINGVYLTINGNLKVTPNHPLWLNGKWQQAGATEVGDKLTGPNGETVVVNSVEVSEEGSNDLYNLHLSGKNHNYFAENVLVHNK